MSLANESKNGVFENKIQQWVSLDNNIKVLTEKLKELRDKKCELGDTILGHVKENNLSNSTIHISDGKLKFVNTKIQQPLTFRYLEKSLGEIIKNDSQVNQIMDHIKQKRETKIVPEIKRS